ncbi:MAG TPA: hypothetical protein VIL79_11230, partial [Thermoleophilia bacterium]
LAAAFGVSRATAATSMHRASTGAQGGSAGCNRLMSDPAAVKAMQPLHAAHVKDMQAWQKQYGKDPTSAQAQAALKTMRKQHVREMRAAFEKLGIKVPAGACDGSMMDGTNGTGMMGGSGAAGDVHQQHHDLGSAGSSGVSNMMGGATTSGMMGGGTF